MGMAWRVVRFSSGLVDGIWGGVVVVVREEISILVVRLLWTESTFWHAEMHGRSTFLYVLACAFC